mgnify:FL=1
MNIDYAIAAIFGTFFLAIILIGLASYVLTAFGLFTMAKNRNIENAWVAWVPVAQLYILGKLIKTLDIAGYEIPQVELALPGIAVAGTVFSGVPLIGTLASIASLVIGLFALHKLYTLYRPDQATLYIILSIVLPFMGPIFIFLMRNDAMVYGEA